MSLDVGLYIKAKDACPTCNHKQEDEGVFDANITHNLNTMAEKAEIYKHLWRPEEIGITTAKQLIEPLKKGLQDMKDRPEYFKQFNPSNGWGSYKVFVPWIEKYLDACIEYPDAEIHTSR